MRFFKRLHVVYNNRQLPGSNVLIGPMLYNAIQNASSSHNYMNDPYSESLSITKPPRMRLRADATGTSSLSDSRA